VENVNVGLATNCGGMDPFITKGRCRENEEWLTNDTRGRHMILQSFLFYLVISVRTLIEPVYVHITLL
jgi:hypothetical protein